MTISKAPSRTSRTSRAAKANADLRTLFAPTRRSSMALYSAADCLYSHRARLVLHEKNISAEVIIVTPENTPLEVAGLNPYHTLPILIDRDLTIYHSPIIMDYMDERFPHPPLMPIDPISRARTRLILYRIERDWYSLLEVLDSKPDRHLATRTRKALRESLTSSAPLFAQKAFFLSDEMSMVDCSLAPLLWRLPHYGVELPTQAKAVEQYGKRLFAREAFQTSLTETERELRRP